jgi:RHS Repeat
MPPPRSAGVPNWSYEYDPNGNLKRAVDPVGTGTTSYVYDVENRLVYTRQ